MYLKQSYTVCYIKRSDGKTLFLERNKKKNDFNHAKFIGIGGKIEEDESPHECVIREVYEETGLKLESVNFCGLVKYYLNEDYFENMYVYYSDDYSGELKECDEGSLHWLSFGEFIGKPHWESDVLFIQKAIYGEKFPDMEFFYDSKGIKSFNRLDEDNIL